MDLIVHLIRLHPDTDPAEFEAWVRETDYHTCPRLPSVRAFSVQRTATPGHYFEVIQVSSRADFEQDMHTPDFKGLVTAFDTMATVTAEYEGTRIDPGYQA
ncbi:RedY protein [Nocardia sp. XZ_19_385]|uniref:RedY protein n=1 Tax=Nocardia sp. XZ_19_385 TaxID=2769488 RepID=UPI0018904F7C|nr:RedY protein [Nocardia sp. XZ_19_385]